MKKSWLALVAFVALTGCGGETIHRQEQEVRKERLLREVADEVSVGRAMAAKLFGQFGRYEDPALESYVTLVGQGIARRSGRPELQFHFGILALDDYNAFAAPGGYILLTRGLLRQLRDEAELAAVISHEIAHVNEKHLYRAIMSKREVGASETFARILSRGAGDLGQSLSAAVTSGLSVLLKQGLAPEQEFAADESGALYAAANGYNPYALPQLLERARMEGKVAEASRTHPAASKRVERLRTYLKENGFADRALGQTEILRSRFEVATAGVHK